MSLLFENIAVLNEDFSVSRDRWVRVDGPAISYIGGGQAGAENRSAPEAPETLGAPNAVLGGQTACPGGLPKADETIDGRGLLLMPGFYNAHAHAPMSLMRGYGENMKLQDWLTRKIFPFEDKLTGDDVYYATMLAMAESFAHGIVSSSEQYFFCEDMLRAAAESGAKMNLSRGLSFFGEFLDADGFVPLAESRKLHAGSHGAFDGRMRVDIALHAEYTATQGLVDAVAGLLRETGAPIQVHVSETQSEHEACKERHGGLTPTAWLARGGAFDNGGIAAHCVWVTEEDADILREKGVMAACCPMSNLKLGGGVMNVPMLFGKGVGVAIGTDGTASNNSLNFFEELKLFALLSKERFGDPTLITPGQALYAATRAGALVQGREDCGFLKEGARADFLVIDLNSPSLNPVCDLASALVYAASSRDIRMTVVDGRIVFRSSGGNNGNGSQSQGIDRPAPGASFGDFPTMDLEKVIFEANRAKTRILGELGTALS
jgi:5-methylthioadenosine/S-adenosylhomocysteine deaminase